MPSKKYCNTFIGFSKGRAQPWSDHHHYNVAICWAWTVGRCSTKCAAHHRHRSKTGWSNNLNLLVCRTCRTCRGCSVPAMCIWRADRHTARAFRTSWEGQGRYLINSENGKGSFTCWKDPPSVQAAMFAALLREPWGATSSSESLLLLLWVAISMQKLQYLRNVGLFTCVDFHSHHSPVVTAT